jgi:hypothetical protein
MLKITKYNFDLTKVSAIAIDTTGLKYLWIAFEQNTNEICELYKVSANDLYQVYFRIELEVDKITHIKESGSFIYLTVNDENLLGYKIVKATPLSIQYEIDKPSGITENAVDFEIDDNYLYFLIPNNVSGEIPKIIITDLNGDYSETIDLEYPGEVIENVKSITKDDSDNLWIITNSNPTQLIRAYKSGEDWIIELTKIE